MTLICCPIQAQSLKDLQQKLKKVSRSVDIVEVWIDHLPNNISAKQVLSSTKKKILVVNKPKKEKGTWQGTEKQRIERLKEFCIAGVSHMDIGIDTKKNLVKDLVNNKRRTKIIASYHNFSKTPSETFLWKKVEKGFSMGADIVKIATFANNNEDNLKIFNILKKANKKKKKVVIMCMGEKGKISRVVGAKLGSYMTFVAIDSKQKSAPGQLTLAQYKTFDSLMK